jgi:hypothetical protein
MLKWQLCYVPECAVLVGTVGSAVRAVLARLSPVLCGQERRNVLPIDRLMAMGHYRPGAGVDPCLPNLLENLLDSLNWLPPPQAWPPGARELQQGFGARRDWARRRSGAAPLVGPRNFPTTLDGTGL